MDFRALEDVAMAFFAIIAGIFALLTVGSFIAAIVGLFGLAFGAAWGGALALEAGITFGMLLLFGGGFFVAITGCY